MDGLLRAGGLRHHASSTISTPQVNVVLRGLNINGTGADNGILMTSSGSTLSVENCVISAFVSSAIALESLASVRIVDSILRANGSSGGSGVYADLGTSVTITGTKIFGSFFGVYVAGSATTFSIAAIADSNLSTNAHSVYVCANVSGSTAKASVTRSTLASNGSGVRLGNCVGTKVVTVSYNLVTGNTAGFWNEAAGTFETEGNNTLRQNTNNTLGTITTVSGG